MVFDWGADRINYNCTGGWKAMEQKGYARCKEGIMLHAADSGGFGTLTMLLRSEHFSVF